MNGATTSRSSTGGLTMNGSTLFLNGRLLNNRGAANWSGGYIFSGAGSIISNAPSATFDITFDGQTFSAYGGNRRFANAGLLRKTGGTGSAIISDAVYNTGTIEARSGTFGFGNTFVQSSGITLLNGESLSASIAMQILGGTSAVMAASPRASSTPDDAAPEGPRESCGFPETTLKQAPDSSTLSWAGPFQDRPSIKSRYPALPHWTGR